MPSSSAAEVRAEAEIRCSAETIFDVIADFSGQDRWLVESSAYRGTGDISDDPVILGTRYREVVPSGVRHGTVTQLERPTKISFDEPMTMKFGAGVIALTIGYTLAPKGDSTLVTRTIIVGVPGRLRLFRAVMIRAIRVESERTLEALKDYADTLQ